MAGGEVYTAASTHSRLVGSGGADTLNASEAGDTLTGGAGADVFHLGVKPWEPIRITDFQVGADKLDVSSLLRTAGYSGSDPVGAGYISFVDNGAGGTNVTFDRDGRGDAQPWPERIITLDNLRYDPAAAGQMLSAPAAPMPSGAFVLFAGQSNMGGKNTSAANVDADWKPDPLTFIWQPVAHTWVQMQPGTNTGWADGEEPTTWGPEVEFAIQFRAAHPDTPLYIVKDVHGGTTLYSEWDPHKSGHLFDQLTAMVAEAGGALGGRRPDILLWGQGEEDATTQTMAQAYQGNLTEFFAAARAQWLGAADGKIGYFRIDTIYPYSAAVREAQANVDAADPNAASFDADPFPLQDDHDHFTAQGLNQVGAGFFNLYAQLVGGGSGGQTLAGGAGADSLQGGGGADLLYGAGGADTLFGGDGADRIYAETPNGAAGAPSGPNILRGEAGDDLLVGGRGADEINGNVGNDTIDGGPGGPDTLYGGQGDDLIRLQVSGSANGNIGADSVTGSDGADTLWGGQGNDTIVGGAGDDWLSGDRGDDVLRGGAGADTFHAWAASGLDRILDFNRAEGDRVQLDAGTRYTLAQVGEDVVVDMGGGNEVILVQVRLDQLGAGWISA